MRAALLVLAAAQRAAALSSQPPFEDCVPGYPAWHVWRVFSSHTAVVEGENLRRLRVTRKSLDSSVATFASYVARRVVHGAAELRYEDPVVGCPAPWASDATRCALHFSPFARACVRVEARRRFRLGVDRNASVTWGDASTARQRRALFFGAAVAMHRSAATISEAYQLHYAMGVGTGVIFAAVLLVALLLSQVSTTPTRRRGLVVATTLGYGLAVWKYFFRVAVHGLAAWPRVTATYVAVAAGASVLATRYVRSTAIFFDAVKGGCRTAALLLAFHATRSVGYGLVAVLGFAYAGLTDADLPWRAALGAFAALLAGDAAAARAPPRRSAAAATPPRDGKNFLHGHRFLTKAEFDDEGERATRDAVAALAATPAYAAWLAENHGRLTVAPAARGGDSDSD